MKSKDDEIYNDGYYEYRTDVKGCRLMFLLMVSILIFIFLIIITCHKVKAQSWQDSNRGLYPQSIQATVNVRNTAVGLRYGYLFREQPFGIYGSFSNTIAPNPDYNNYDWERKYSIGGMMQLPYNMKMRGIHTFITAGVVYNSHKDPYIDYPGRYDARLYYTSNVGCDIGMEWQLNHFKCHLTVDVVNFMRYIQIGCGYTFFKLK